MDIAQLRQTLEHDAVALVFMNVLLQQIGLPVPAVPTLLVAGSLAASPWALGKVLAAAILASVIADAIWYAAGRRFGYRVLAGLCRLSINPASCVSQTEARFVRWGLSSLVVAQLCGLLMSPISRTAVVLSALAAKKGEGAADPAAEAAAA